MRLSARYAVPTDLALLYEFVNTLDLRHFIQQGAPHAADDEIATPEQLRAWMRARSLLSRGKDVSAKEYLEAIRLRQALREFLAAPADVRVKRADIAKALCDAAAAFPLVVQVSSCSEVSLQPAPGASGLSRIVAELYRLDVGGRLDRLKMCASDECHWVFYDRSKPGNRRWCSAALCGNREKTRNYRMRRRAALSRRAKNRQSGRT
jgi:predicted RNA-binding Zn ribbon-like protein